MNTNLKNLASEFSAQSGIEVTVTDFVCGAGDSMVEKTVWSGDFPNSGIEGFKARIISLQAQGFLPCKITYSAAETSVYGKEYLRITLAKGHAALKSYHPDMGGYEVSAYAPTVGSPLNV